MESFQLSCPPLSNLLCTQRLDLSWFQRPLSSVWIQQKRTQQIWGRTGEKDVRLSQALCLAWPYLLTKGTFTFGHPSPCNWLFNHFLRLWATSVCLCLIRGDLSLGRLPSHTLSEDRVSLCGTWVNLLLHELWVVEAEENVWAHRRNSPG